ncbi:MAG: hypothetical protein FJ386_10205 [Verrucomicrobia bacterium]|nr:hypothetical protein [Verrucomicrobiota bacterium]
MSLKAFHIVFITASTLLSFGFGAWELHAWRTAGATSDLVLACGSTLAGAGLLAYGRYFLKKLKHISYL